MTTKYEFVINMKAANAHWPVVTLSALWKRTWLDWRPGIAMQKFAVVEGNSQIFPAPYSIENAAVRILSLQPKYLNDSSLLERFARKGREMGLSLTALESLRGESASDLQRSARKSLHTF
jgi:hypothetical protein